MAHYAELNDKNQVIRVVVIPNEVEPTEQHGIEYCKKICGGQHWKKTSYNGSIRRHFAGYMFTYDWVRDAFIPPRPHASWQFDEQTCNWSAPKPYPNDGKMYYWDELSLNWILLQKT